MKNICVLRILSFVISNIAANKIQFALELWPENNYLNNKINYVFFKKIISKYFNNSLTV